MSTAQTLTPAELNNRKLLGTFLRTRRESLDPNRLGLPRMRQRRTPGLRREEVAQLADVGVTWYTWLEQGRDIKASTKTLTAIASALQCNDVETQHLFSLAGHTLPSTRVAAACCKLAGHNQQMLDAIQLPAIIETPRFDILGYNQAWCALMGVDLAQIAPEDRNCIWLAFNHAGWRNVMTDWDEVMPQMVAMFRGQMGEHLGDPHWESFLARLLNSSDEFAHTWQRYELGKVENRVKRFYRAEVGEMILRQNNWWSASRNGDRLLVYVPNDAASAAALQQLTTR
ncbi:helix-turn-helix transcriptional regulator [Pantoea dispersa]|uniref:DNA-binding protein n=1 Tax=Pantoea dispersa TaxID=59814 RepID=A0A8E1V6S3_9GAMM|nr:helix-turn-helix transcriptional regulator [Pantoea dispersa]KTR90018.1 DNA-binding protein [Pantoea dispersa]KTS22875.1 DNA-binding protein [Pantoea dispersa]KTS57614.1 DNA-binding protein [Pantoea dispersa]KTS66366.1 DNA-binding protein [Pantoea dispersa]